MTPNMKRICEQAWRAHGLTVTGGIKLDAATLGDQMRVEIIVRAVLSEIRIMNEELSLDSNLRSTRESDQNLRMSVRAKVRKLIDSITDDYHLLSGANDE